MAPTTFLVALLSRALAVNLAIMSDVLLPDHAAEGALLYRLPSTCVHASRLASFTRWDSAHFLTVAQHGWETEYSHAFFPLYPWLVRGASWLLGPLSHLLCEGEVRIVAAVLVSNSAFVAAACCLHALGDRVLRDPPLARAAAWLFCVAPSSVFFSSAYSEATYAACAFGGMLARG